MMKPLLPGAGATLANPGFVNRPDAATMSPSPSSAGAGEGWGEGARVSRFPRLSTICCTFLVTVAVLFLTTTQAQPTNPTSAPTATTNQTQPQVQSPTQRVEAMRDACLQGRRLICGKILRVYPDGLVVESGYTNLLRAPLTQSWLVRGTAAASPTPNLVEGAEPGCIAVGVVYLTSLPKSRGAKPAQYDYVIIEAYPAGQHTYTTIGNVSHTVRRFSANLPKAVQLNLDNSGN